VPNYLLGEFAVECGELVAQVAILMLNVGNGVGEALLVLKEVADGRLLLMRLHEIISLDTICKTIRSKRN
jgi:hypothetical protein